jgi:glycosyltransferase involved in cell wall biosynthesis
VFLRQCKSLQNKGFKVSILTNDGQSDEELEGISIYACSQLWPRWATLVAAKRQFLAKALEIDADIYQIHSPELLGMGLALKRRGKKIVYDAHEDMPRHILEKEWLPLYTRSAIAKSFELYMLYALAQYDQIISPHSHVVRELQAKLGKGVVVANFPIVSEQSASVMADFADRGNVLIYSGTVYRYSNQEEILTALGAFENVEYRIAGHIDEAHAAKLLSSAHGHKASFLGRLNRSDLARFYQSALVGLVVYDYKLNLGWKLGSYGTNKVFEYMEAGIPFICTDYDLWKDIVDRYNCGICVTPGSVEEITAAMKLLITNKELAFEMGKNGRRAVLEEFNWASEEEKYIKLFEKLAQC